jgi:phosphate transport system substrate-binding protein
MSGGYVDADEVVQIGGAEHVEYIVSRFDALFAQTHPGVRFSESMKGTSTSLPLLTAGVVPFASVGRGINAFEKTAYRRAVGGTPLEIRVAHAANDTSKHLATSLSVYVNRANPITSMSMASLGKVLSIGNPGGDYARWGQLGLSKEWANRAVHVYGTPEYSGFGDYLQETHLKRRVLAPETEHYGTTELLLARLAQDPAGLTIAGINRDDAQVKSIALLDANGKPTTGTAEEVISGRYPLGRFLYFYLRRVPGKPLDPFVIEYMRLVLSREGQAIIASQDKGYIPLTAEEARVELAKLDGVTGHAENAHDMTSDLPPLATVSAAADTITLVGGNGMAEWATALNQLFQHTYPHARTRMAMQGSATAMPALTAGIADLAPMTRVAFSGERAGFKQQYGYQPEVIRIGYQGYAPRQTGNVPPAVYVNRRNPLPGLTVKQLARVFTSGAPEGDINLWSQLAPAAVPQECAARVIHVYGGRDDGGALTALRQSQFGGHPFAVRYEALADDAAVLDAVADDVCGIGLTGWANPRPVAAQVRLLALGTVEGHYSEPTYEAVAEGRYPLSPHLLVYFNHREGQPLPANVKAYLTMALSDKGQAILAKLKDNDGGFVPLAPAELARERARLKGM